MSDQFLGELRMMAFGFAPNGWAFCNGQLLSINQNQALFALLGTQYGGDGVTNFALPNLQGRLAVGAGAGLTQGQTPGEAAVTLTASQIPTHTHPVSCSTAPGTQTAPTNGVWAADSGGNSLFTTPPSTPMSSAAIGSQGSSTPHPNQQPYLAVGWAIALTGIFPSRG
jgi:microcystin-dependent protein